MTRAIAGEFSQFAVATTMKHFPALEYAGKRHGSTPSSPLSKEEVMLALEIFRRVTGETDFAMSTHDFAASIDDENIATFSKVWIDILREQIGFEGLLMTDGLFMIDGYFPGGVNLLSAEGQAALRPKQSGYAVRAILAGHDLIFLEGSAADTRKVFEDIHTLACQKSQVADELRARIFRAHKRIRTYKESRRLELTSFPEPGGEVVAEAGRLHWNIATGNGPPEICTNDQSWEAILSKIEPFQTRGQGKKAIQSFKEESPESARPL